MKHRNLSRKEVLFKELIALGINDRKLALQLFDSCNFDFESAQKIIVFSMLKQMTLTGYLGGGDKLYLCFRDRNQALWKVDIFVPFPSIRLWYLGDGKTSETPYVVGVINGYGLRGKRMQRIGYIPEIVSVLPGDKQEILYRMDTGFNFPTKYNPQACMPNWSEAFAIALANAKKLTQQA